MLVELRLMIYEHLIEAGDLGMLRISKLVNQEAFPLLSEVAILRINEPCPTMLSRVTLALTGSVTLCGLFTLTPPDYIQHLDLRLNMVHSQGFFINMKLMNWSVATELPESRAKSSSNFPFPGISHFD